MNKKIYLSPSNQTANAYAAGGTTEAQQCYRIATAAKVSLERCGFQLKLAPYDQDMWDSIQESNSWGADLHICIHTNAGGGQGTMVMVCEQAEQNLQYARPIYDALRAVTLNGYGYGIREYPHLSELNSTTAIAVYCECEFHDRSDLAEWIIANVGVLGEAISKGVCKAYSVEYTNNKPDQTDMLYRVQVGAYSQRQNADNTAAKLKAKGFDTYIVQAGGLYKVQVGAYANKSNADAMASKIKTAGFDTYITTEQGNAVESVPTPSPAPSKPYGPNPTITWDYQYDTQIAELQQILNSKNNHLNVDGISGASTYAACKQYTINNGDQGPLTKWTQERLNTLGYHCGTADGIAGTKTMAGIAKFQRANGLGVGHLGGTDWYYLIR